MLNPKISILFTLYNGKKYLDYSLNSILSQTYDNFEVLITDDGSSDNSAQYIMDNFSDYRIKLFIQGNKGKSAALNNCLSNITGDYVTVFDHDDYLNKYFLENSVFAINRTNADCILCSIKIVYDYCPKLQDLAVKPLKENDVEIIDYHEAMNLYCSDEEIHFYLGNKIFKKEIFDGFHFNPNLILDDISSTHLLMARCKLFSVVKSSIYYHTSILKSLGTKTSGRVIMEELANTYLNRYKHFEKHSPNKIYYKLIYKDTINILMALQLKLIPNESDPDLLIKISEFLKSKQVDLEKNTNRKVYILSRLMLDDNFNIKNEFLKIPLNLIIYLNQILKRIHRTINYYIHRIFAPC